MKIRPEIDQNLVKKVKIAYPEETSMLTNAQTVEWAINKILEKNSESKKDEQHNTQ
jgi:hypothetical protein